MDQLSMYGRCKVCFSLILHSVNKLGEYKNSCTNKACKHFKWHTEYNSHKHLLYWYYFVK